MSFFTKNAWGQTIDLSDTYGTKIDYVWGTRETGSEPTYNQSIRETGLSSGDYYGSAVAIGCNRIVVSAPSADTDGLYNNGSVYIYDMSMNKLATVVAQSGIRAGNSYYGVDVAVADGLIVVGMTGTGTDYGYVEVLDLNGNYKFTINQVGNYVDSDFGYRVAIGCGVIAVGETAWDDTPTTASRVGRLHLFDYSGTLIQTIVNPFSTNNGSNSNARFPSDIAIGDGKVIAGNGGRNDKKGRVYVYDLKGNLIKELQDPDDDHRDKFGNSVAIGSGKIVIGAPEWDYSVRETSDGGQGAFYIFDSNLNFESRQTLGLTSYTEIGFGFSVDVKHGRIVVGSKHSDQVSRPHWSTGFGNGLFRVYDLEGNYLWERKASHVVADQIPEVTPESNTTTADFGYAVGIYGGKIIVSATRDESGTTGVYGGALHVYDTEYSYTVEDAIDLSVRS